MTIEHDRVELMDSGLFALATVLRLFGLQAKADEISQCWGTSRLGAAEMLSCARQAGLRARWQGVSGDELAGIELPGIVSLRDGNFVILADVRTESVFVADQASRSMKEMSRAE